MRQLGPSPSAVLSRLRDEIAARIAERQVEVVRVLVSACFRGQHDPDGSPWPERADGSGKPLLLTIEDALEFYSDSESVYVDCPSKPYADYQFWGTRAIPSRQWAPAPGMPMPPKWQAAVDASVRVFIADAWRAAGARQVV